MKKTLLFAGALALGAIALSLSTEARAGADEGKATFDTMCVTCHGASGKGDGPAGAALNPTPADFTSPEFWATRTTDDLKTVVTSGGAAVGKSPIMPAWGPVIGEQGVTDVVAYIEATFKPAGEAAPAAPAAPAE
jgi:mono/diheme cytochrome c family protein